MHLSSFFSCDPFVAGLSPNLDRQMRERVGEPAWPGVVRTERPSNCSRSIIFGGDQVNYAIPAQGPKSEIYRSRCRFFGETFSPMGGEQTPADFWSRPPVWLKRSNPSNPSASLLFDHAEKIKAV